MCRKKYRVYRVWYCLWFQASMGSWNASPADKGGFLYPEPLSYAWHPCRHGVGGGGLENKECRGTQSTRGTNRKQVTKRTDHFRY